MAQFKPPNVANASLGYDAVAIVAKILTRQDISTETTPIAAAARGVDAGHDVALKDYVGMNHYKMRENGDAYIPTRAVKHRSRTAPCGCSCPDARRTRRSDARRFSRRRRSRSDGSNCIR